MSEYNGQTTTDGHRCAVLGESVTAKRRCALGPTTLTEVDMACHFAVTVLFKNAIGWTEFVTLATDTAHCAQSTGKIIQTGTLKEGEKAGFSATLSITNLTWTGTGLNPSHWTDMPISNTLSHGIVRFVMSFDVRTWTKTLNSVALVRERTIPTERPPPVGEVSANFLRIEGCHVVSAMVPHSRFNLCFLDRSRYFFIQVAPQLTSRGWVDPVPDLLLLRKSGSAVNRTRDLCICSQKLWPLDHRGGLSGIWQWQNCYCKFCLRHQWKSRSCDPFHSWLLPSGSYSEDISHKLTTNLYVQPTAR